MAYKEQKREQAQEKIWMAEEGILGREHSMNHWKICLDSRAKRAIDHKIRSLAGGFAPEYADAQDSGQAKFSL